MEKLKNIYVWEFWFSNNPKNKIYWYIEKVNWSYKLFLSKSFFPKKIQGLKSWKRVITNEKIWIINWNLIENNIYPWTKLITLFWLSSFEDWMDTKEYYFKYMIFDYHFLDEKDIKFKSFKFSFDWLFQFFWKWIFEINQINNTWWNSFFNPDEINIKVDKEALKSIKFLELNWLNYSFKNLANQKNITPTFCSRDKTMWLRQWLEIKNNLFIFVESDNNKISLLEIEKLLINFQRFFTLIFWYNIKLNSLWIKYKYFHSEKEKDFYKQSKCPEYRNIDIGIILNELYVNEILSEESKKLTRIETLFNYDEVNNDFWNIVKTFFENTEKYKTIYNLYYATLQNQNLHLENQFLNFIQAIEWMYLKSSIYKKNLNDSVIIEIKEKIKELNKKLKDNILVKEEKTLTSKLKDIEKYLWVKFELIEWQNLKELIQKIRNIFSHWWDRGDFVNLDLLNIVELLKTVLELFILKELWLKDDLYNSIKEYKINLELNLNVV